MSCCETQQKARFSSITSADIKVGAEYGPYTHELTHDMLNLWVKTFNDDNPFYTDAEKAQASAYRGLISPPGMQSMFFLMGAMDAFEGMPPGMVLAKQTYEYYEPARPGEPLTMKVRIVDKYERKGRPWIVVNVVNENPRGEKVAETTVTWILEK